MMRRNAWAVLAAGALAVLACGLPGASAVPTVPAGPSATPAIYLPVEWTPTPAPPTPDVPEGWQEFGAGRVHLWLPGSYEGGDMGAGFEAIVNKLKALGPDFAQTAQILEQNPDVFILWAFDTVRGPSGYVTNVNVTREDVPGGVSVEEYLQASLNMLPSQFTLVDQTVLDIGSRRVGKLVLSSDIEGLRGMSVIYSVQDGETFWNVTYSTGADEFIVRNPVWEQSIRTLQLDE